METTTTDGGATAQPEETPVAVATAHNDDQVITTDDNGTPTMTPVTSQAADQPSEQAAETTEVKSESSEQTAEAADKTDAEIAEWSEKKGLKINPENPNEVRLARMQLDNERKFHEANQATKTTIQPPELLDTTGNPDYDPIVERQNQTDLKLYVRDWFDANPEMKDHRDELQRIAIERPYLQDMEDIRAHFLANPSREAQLKSDGGREALTNLAQKQSQIPPGANATNSGVYASEAINPRNVFDQIDKHDQAWFEKHHDAINKAIAGK